MKWQSRSYCWVVVALLVSVVWAVAIVHLRPEWSLNPQYYHGWLVPLLGLYSFRMRLETCPAPGEPSQFWMVATGVGMIVLMTALSIPIREANPDWRFLGWLLSGLAMGLTFLWLANAGGGVWVRHFAFPVLFFLTAVPWPRPQENAIMAELMDRNTVVATEALRWLGFEATAKGNLIRLPTGVVGVEEACSGIRSLQGGMMMTLFAGELFRLGWVSRGLLFGAGLGWVLMANMLRTVLLGVIAAREGPAAVDRWHDIAGYAVLGLGFLLLLGLALALRRVEAITGRRHPDLPAAVAVAPSLSAAAYRMRHAGVIGLGVLLASVIVTQVWYSWQERNVMHLAAWSVRFPRESPGYREYPIAERIRGDLRYDEAASAGWNDIRTWRWRALFFRWKPGFNGEQTVQVHDPRVCLQASGLEIVETLPRVRVEREGLILDFDAFRFRNEATEPIFVFNTVTSDAMRANSPPLSSTNRNWDVSARFQAVAAGVRHMGQRRLEVAIFGATSNRDAVDAFRQFLVDHLLVDSRTIGNQAR